MSLAEEERIAPPVAAPTPAATETPRVAAPAAPAVKPRKPRAKR